MSGEGVLQVPFSSGCRLDPPGPRPALLWVGAGLVPPKYPPALPRLENSYRLLHKVNIDKPKENNLNISLHGDVHPSPRVQGPVNYEMKHL